MNTRLQAQYSWLLSILEDLKRAVLYPPLPNILPFPSVVSHVHTTRGKKAQRIHLLYPCTRSLSLSLSSTFHLYLFLHICLPCLLQTPSVPPLVPLRTHILAHVCLSGSLSFSVSVFVCLLGCLTISPFAGAIQSTLLI